MFMVFTAGRSRTYWLSQFLTYGPHICHFETVARLSHIEEVIKLLRDGNGAAETVSAMIWPKLLHGIPSLKAVVVRRPKDEIIASFIEAAEKTNVKIDKDFLSDFIPRVIGCLDKLSLQPQTLTAEFHDLDQEDACRAIFEHCLPCAYDHDWWLLMRDKVMDPFDVYPIPKAALMRTCSSPFIRNHSEN